jgi:hypothetical protein
MESGHSSIMRRRTLIITCCLAATLSGFAGLSSAQESSTQEPPEKEKDTTAAAHISIIALGPVPRRRYKMPGAEELEDMNKMKIAGTDSRQNNDKTGDQALPGSEKSPNAMPDISSIPVMLPPLEGSIPPGTLYYKTPKSKSSAPWARVSVGFNNATAITKVHAGIPLNFCSIEAGGNNVYQSYFKLDAMAPCSQVIVFLTPSTGGKTYWKSDPKVTVLNLCSPDLIDKTLLLKNFSAEPVAFVVDESQPEILNPGQTNSFAVARKIAFHQVTAIKLKDRVRVIDTSVSIPFNTMSVFAFFDADPLTNGGKNVGVFRSTCSKLPQEVLKQAMPTQKSE